MIKTLFTSILLTISIISLAQERTFSESKKGYKYGLQEQVGETEMNTIIKTKYEKITTKNGYFLYKKGNYETDIYKDCYFLDSNLQILRNFNKVEKVNSQNYIVKKDGQKALYNLVSNSFPIENANNIELVTTKDKSYLIVHENGQTGIYSIKLDLLFSLEGKRKVSALTGAFSKYHTRTFPFLIIDESIYNTNGEELISGVRNITPSSYLKDTVIEDYSTHSINNRKTIYDHYWSVQSKKNKIYLIKNKNIIFKGIPGKSIRKIKHPNKIIVEKENGWIVYDSLQNTWSDTVFQDLLEPEFSEYGYRRYSAVQLNDQWFFVDEKYHPIDDKKYEYIKDFDSNSYCEVKENNGNIFIYDAYGTKLIDTPLKKVKQPKDFMYDELIVVNKDGKEGLINSDSTVSGFAYDLIKVLNDEILGECTYVGYKNDEAVLINTHHGEYFTGMGVEDIYFIDNELFNEWNEYKYILEKGGEFSVAYINYDYGDDPKKLYKVVGNFEFQELVYTEFMNDYGFDFVLLKKDGLWGIHSFRSEENIVPFEYDEIKLNWDDDEVELVFEYFNSIIVKRNGKTGMIKLDNSFKEIIPCIYDEIIVDEDMLIIKKNGLYGAINDRLETIINPVLKGVPSRYFIDSYKNIIMSCKLNNKKGKCMYYFDELIFFDDIENAPFNPDVYLIKSDARYGLWNSYQNDTILLPEFSKIELHPNEDWYVTTKDDKYGIYNYEGNPVLENNWDEIKLFQMNQYDFVKKNNKWGIFNENASEMALEVVYDAIECDEEFIYAEKDGLWQAFDASLQLVSKKKFNKLKDLKKRIDRVQ